MIKRATKRALGFIHIQFHESEIRDFNIGEQRRIRMVNYIGLITMLTMLSYAAVYTYLDYDLFQTAIFFLLFSSITVGFIMFINKAGYYNTGKVLIALVNPISMASTATWIFGKEPDFQTFLLLSTFIPLFLWPLSKKVYLIIFLFLNYGLYIIIEYLPPQFSPLIKLSKNYIEQFSSTNVLVCFIGASAAIAFYTLLAAKIEKKLVEKTKELEESQHHQDLVYSIIAHDLRSPLNSLLGISELLEQNFELFEKDKGKQMINAVFQSSNSLNDLLNNLLEWSKLKSKKENINFTFFKLYPIVDDTINLLNDMAVAKNISLKNRIEPGIRIYADANMVSTVLRNLVVNAIKFTNSEGWVRITNTKMDKMLRVCVEDNGIGIDQQYHKNLFNVKSTYTNRGTNSEKGSGLGLKICGDFVKANGGEIWLESELNVGSRFYFTLHLEKHQ